MKIDFTTALNNTKLIYTCPPQYISVKGEKLKMQKHSFFRNQQPDKINDIRNRSLRFINERTSDIIETLRAEVMLPLSQNMDIQQLKAIIVQRKIILKNCNREWMRSFEELHSTQVKEAKKTLQTRINNFEKISAKWDIKYPLNKLLTALGNRYEGVYIANKVDGYAIPEYLIFAPLVPFAWELLDSCFDLNDLRPFLTPDENKNLDLLIKIIKYLKEQSNENGAVLNNSLKKQLMNTTWVKQCTPDKMISSERHLITTVKEKNGEKFLIELFFICNVQQGKRTFTTVKEWIKVRKGNA